MNNYLYLIEKQTLLDIERISFEMQNLIQNNGNLSCFKNLFDEYSEKLISLQTLRQIKEGLKDGEETKNSEI